MKPAVIVAELIDRIARLDETLRKAWPDPAQTNAIDDLRIALQTAGRVLALAAKSAAEVGDVRVRRLRYIENPPRTPRTYRVVVR